MGTVILVVSVIICIAIGALVISRGIRDKVTLVYLALTATLLIMCIANYLSLTSNLNQLLNMRLVMASSSVVISLIVALILLMGKRNSKLLRGGGLALITAAIVLLDMSPVLFSDVIAGPPLKPVVGSGIIVYFLHFFVMLYLAAIELYRMGKRTRSSKQKKQYRSLIIGIVPAVLFAPITSFVLPNFFGFNELVAFTPLYGAIFSVGVGYAIVRHGLFDVKRVAVRTVAYSLSMFTMAAVYFGLAYIASITLFRGPATSDVSVSPINIALALILAFIFQPIKRFFDKITDSIFYRESYDTNDFITRLGKVLTSTTKLREVLELSGTEIYTTLKSSGYLFFVYRDHHPDEIVGEGLKGDFDAETYEAIHYLSKGRNERVVLVASLESSLQLDQRRLYNEMTKRGVALMLPLLSNDEAIGCLLLGEQQAGGYTKRDIGVLEAVADSLVIAIQNARSIQVVRDLNTHLEQKINSATKELRSSNKRLVALDAVKDEFVSMASHQLRTPLTSIKGYLSMVLEGDAGKVSPSQRKLLEEAFSSSERMVGLIGDFLNVSRLQTGKFMIDQHKTDIAELVSQEVESMRQIAEAHDMSLKYRRPAAFPHLYVDDNKLRQVVMNFIDNAVYYSPDSAQPITIKLAVEDGYVTFRVTDKGMGVPKSAQKYLFSKFFRAENARKQRPDGTGVGLFLAKKVIDGHSGKLIFESIEGKGSTFGFRLPIKKLSSPPVGDSSKS